MKRVVLISNYFHFKSEKASNRYRELAEMLCKDPEIDLEVITSQFYQRTFQMRQNLDELSGSVDYKVKFIYEPGYNKSVSFQRLKTSRVFAKNTLDYLKTIKKPDLIYQVVPTLDVADLVSGYAKKERIPLVIDIQDLWPEAFKMALNIPILSDIAFLPYALKANRIYSRADEICAVSQTYVDRALSVNKKNNSGHAVYIGINLSEFDIGKNLSKKDDTKTKLTLAYCGSLDVSYDIKTVIDALAIMTNPPKFLVMGDGRMRTLFEEYARDRKIHAEFTGFLPYQEMCKRLCESDITVNPIIGASVASIINKHGDYAASGLPVINSQDSKEYRELIDMYQMGFNCANGNPSELAKKLNLLCENKELRQRMGQNARRCAEERFDRRRTYQELVQVIKKLSLGENNE